MVMDSSNALTYAALKGLAEAAKQPEDFRRKFEELYGAAREEKRRAVRVLAKARCDGEWPWHMVGFFYPAFAEAIKQWSMGGWEDIRLAQCGRGTKLSSEMEVLARHFRLLPRWKRTAYHFSNDRQWFSRLKDGGLTLDSFMSCTTDQSGKYINTTPESVLVFSGLSSARLLGSISREPWEKEVLLPVGAIFTVSRFDPTTRRIYLQEVSARELG